MNRVCDGGCCPGSLECIGDLCCDVDQNCSPPL
jgi:hypothetical protein